MSASPKAVEIRTIPQMDTGAPTPLVLADDSRVLLSYLNVHPDTDGKSTFVSFEHKAAHSLGSPGDETLHGHPLYASGLKHYAALEVTNSPWIESLERTNSVHAHHSAQRFQRLRHFVFTFHDSTFECVAESLTWKPLDLESESERLEYMVNSLTRFAKGLSRSTSKQVVKV